MASHRRGTGQNKTFIIHGLFAKPIWRGEKASHCNRIVVLWLQEIPYGRSAAVVGNASKFRIFSSMTIASATAVFGPASKRR